MSQKYAVTSRYGGGIPNAGRVSRSIETVSPPRIVRISGAIRSQGETLNGSTISRLGSLSSGNSWICTQMVAGSPRTDSTSLPGISFIARVSQVAVVVATGVDRPETACNASQWLCQTRSLTTRIVSSPPTAGGWTERTRGGLLSPENRDPELAPMQIVTASRPRVAIVVHDFDPSLGQGRYCFELIKRLHQEISFDVHANTWVDAGVSDVRYHTVAAVRSNVATTVLTFLASAERSLRAHPAALIHAQGLTCWRADIITGHICSAARMPFLANAGSRARMFARIVTPLERAFYRRRGVAQVIAISKTLGKQIREEYGWVKPMHVIYHGTDTARFRPAHDENERQRLRTRFRLPAGRWLWLFMGEAVKGLATAIAQLRLFPQAHLLVVSRSDMTPFMRQATSAGVLERISFHGFDPKPEEAFRVVDLFLYPNEYDTFGLVVTEAMASGLPVIVGDSIGAAELVQDGQNGLLCRVTSPASVTASLQTLVALPDKGRTLGREARGTAKYYSWDRCAEETLEVYRQALRALQTKSD